jgi:hypothetical protein
MSDLIQPSHAVRQILEPQKFKLKKEAVLFYGITDQCYAFKIFSPKKLVISTYSAAACVRQKQTITLVLKKNGYKMFR